MRFLRKIKIYKKKNKIELIIKFSCFFFSRKKTKNIEILEEKKQ